MFPSPIPVKGTYTIKHAYQDQFYQSYLNAFKEFLNGGPALHIAEWYNDNENPVPFFMDIDWADEVHLDRLDEVLFYAMSDVIANEVKGVYDSFVGDTIYYTKGKTNKIHIRCPMYYVIPSLMKSFARRVNVVMKLYCPTLEPLDLEVYKEPSKNGKTFRRTCRFRFIKIKNRSHDHSYQI